MGLLCSLGTLSAEDRTPTAAYTWDGILTERCLEVNLRTVKAIGRSWRTVPTELWALRSEWAVKEIGDRVRSRRALFRMEETWACFQHEEEEPGERQKLEGKAKGGQLCGQSREGWQEKHRGTDQPWENTSTPGKPSSNPHLTWFLQLSGSTCRTVLLEVRPRTGGISITWGLGCW